MTSPADECSGATSPSPSASRSRLLVARLVLLALHEGLHVTYVAHRALPHGALGVLRPRTRTIVVARDLAFDATAHALSHELAHWLLGHGRTTHPPTDEAEEEAELASYLVCRQFGVATGAWMNFAGSALELDASGSARLGLSAHRAERAAETLIRCLSGGALSPLRPSASSSDGLAV